MKLNKLDRYVGKIINNIEILDIIKYRVGWDKKRNRKFYQTKFKVKCLNCKKIFTRHKLSIYRNSISCMCSWSLPNSGSSKRTLFCAYKSGARKRELEWALDFEKFVELTSKNCYYCNQEPKNKATGDNRMKKIKNKASWENYKYNGIDRLDSNKGYTIDNCTTCCSNCNYAKHEMTINEFLAWVESIYNHWILPNGKTKQR